RSPRRSGPLLRRTAAGGRHTRTPDRVSGGDARVPQHAGGGSAGEGSEGGDHRVPPRGPCRVIATTCHPRRLRDRSPGPTLAGSATLGATARHTEGDVSR